MTSTTAPRSSRRRSLAAPAILLGIGLGGFVDGIVFHQILAWHHMVSDVDRYPPDSLDGLQANVVADGLFHTATWIATVVGIGLLWREHLRGSSRWSTRELIGWVLVGAGTFNLVEGVVDHHLLQVHRVNPKAAEPLVYDIGFLAVGALLVIVGWWLQRGASVPTDPGRPARPPEGPPA